MERARKWSWTKWATLFDLLDRSEGTDWGAELARAVITHREAIAKEDAALKVAVERMVTQALAAFAHQPNLSPRQQKMRDAFARELKAQSKGG